MKKRKANQRVFIIILLIIIFVVCITVLLFNLTTSKTLKMAKNDKDFNKDYTTFYEDITYVDSNNFIKNINSLIELGYSIQDINLIYDTFDEKEINLITNSKYDSDITNYIKLDYFKKENIGRYIAFKYDENKLDYSYFVKDFKKDLTYEDIVTYVNIGLDQEYYTNVNNVSNETDIKILVNKYHKLDEDYEPDDLVLIDTKYATEGQKLRKEAALAFENMAKAAKEDKINIYAGSAYRSYDYQDWLYNKYVLEDGFTNAETYSARAGYSEHQTGLAVDILNNNWTLIDEDDSEYTWLVNNSYKYGFILRYKRGYENITGYMFEDWHFRYLGKEVANDIHNFNLTYEEYIAKQA